MPETPPPPGRAMAIAPSTDVTDLVEPGIRAVLIRPCTLGAGEDPPGGAHATRICPMPPPAARLARMVVVVLAAATTLTATTLDKVSGVSGEQIRQAITDLVHQRDLPAAPAPGRRP